MLKELHTLSYYVLLLVCIKKIFYAIKNLEYKKPAAGEIFLNHWANLAQSSKNFGPNQKILGQKGQIGPKNTEWVGNYETNL